MNTIDKTVLLTTSLAQDSLNPARIYEPKSRNLLVQAGVRIGTALLLGAVACWAVVH
jgi:hypothetical protein